MIKKIHLLLFTILFIFIQYGYSQDFRYSQFFNSPLSLNPALTGKMNSDYRFGLIHRSQWSEINSLFNTTTFYGDINFIKNRFKLDKWSLGLSVTSDELGNGLINGQYINPSFSFLKSLGTRKRHKIGFGIQPSFGTKGLVKKKLIFDSQINKDYEIDPNIVSGENPNPRYYMFMLNVGLVWDYSLNKNTDLSIGYTVDNANTPKESPLFVKRNRLPVRHTLNPNLHFKIGKRINLTATTLIMYQAKAFEKNIGMHGSYLIDAETHGDYSLNFGGFYRINDAFIAMTGLRWKNYNFMFSYDFTNSRLQELNNSGKRHQLGSWELSLTYLGFLKRIIPNDRSIPCKFF